MRVNLFGGAGCGKSTLAAELFHALKVRNVSVELVTEYIKSWAYEGRKLESCDQIYIFAKQQRLEDRVLRRGVKHIVSDSPLFLQCAYAKKQKHMGWEELIGLAHKFDKKYKPLNIFVERSSVITYQQEGRYEDEKAARKMDDYIKKFLDEQGVEYVSLVNDVGNIESYLLKTFANRGLLVGCAGNKVRKKKEEIR